MDPAQRLGTDSTHYSGSVTSGLNLHTTRKDESFKCMPLPAPESDTFHALRNF